jgi:UDP-N-acetylglucosamine kinase
VGQPDPTPYRLSAAEAEQTFRDDIAPDLLSGGEPRAAPVLIVIAGQPGAGKGRAEQAVQAALGVRAAVTIDADNMRPYHPAYDALAQDDDVTAAALTNPAASTWVTMAVEHVAARRVDALLSTTFGSPTIAAAVLDTFRRARYRIELAVVAVDDVRSRLGVLWRYQDLHDHADAGRYTPPHVQRTAYLGLLNTVDRIDREQLVDAVHVYNRAGGQLYTNQATADGWQHPAVTRAAIETERGRRWTREEIEQLVTTATTLGRTLNPTLHDDLTAVVAAARDRIAVTIAARPPSPVEAARAAAHAWPTPTTTPDSTTPPAGPKPPRPQPTRNADDRHR